MTVRIRISFREPLLREAVEAAHNRTVQADEIGLKGEAHVNVEGGRVKVGGPANEDMTRSIDFAADTDHAVDGIAYAAEFASNLSDVSVINDVRISS